MERFSYQSMNLLKNMFVFECCIDIDIYSIQYCKPFIDKTNNDMKLISGMTHAMRDYDGGKIYKNKRKSLFTKYHLFLWYE